MLRTVLPKQTNSIFLVREILKKQTAVQVPEHYDQVCSGLGRKILVTYASVIFEVGLNSESMGTKKPISHVAYFTKIGLVQIKYLTIIYNLTNLSDYYTTPMPRCSEAIFNCY